MSAPHCCQAKKKKHSGLARDRSTVRQAKRNGREWSIRQGRFPPTARLFRRVITLQISLPPRRVRTDCSIHQIAQAMGSRGSLDSGIPEIDVDQRLHDQSIVAQPGPSPPGNPPGNAVRPAGRSRQASRPRFSSGGDLLRFCRLSVTTSADARTCPLQGGLPNPALDGTLQGCFARGLWLSAPLLFHHAREMAVLLLTVTATS